MNTRAKMPVKKDIASFFSKKQLMQEVIQLTSEIRVLYPELYKVLEETPLFPFAAGISIYPQEFEQYLQTLKGQVLHYNQTRLGSNKATMESD